jgi:hypothetical protein
MTVYTYAQLEQLWINNGGSRAKAPLAAAIAEAESSGRSDVTSPNPDGGTNVGPWQLDTLGKGSGHTVAQLQDPNTNAAVAVSGSSNGTDWSAWETYVNGAYKKFMNGATSPDPNVPGGSGGSATLTAASGSDCLIGPFPHTSWCLLNKGQGRALIGGSMLVAGGLIMAVGLALVAVFALGRSGVAQQVVSYTPLGKLPRG